MTTSAITRAVNYVENGISVEYPLPFQFLSNGDVKAERTLANGSVQLLAYGSDYSVTGAGSPSGGTLTVTAPAVAGTKLALWSDTSRGQQTDYDTNDTFPADSHEAALDRLDLVDQEQDRELGRTLRAARGVTPPPVGAITDGQVLGMIAGTLLGVEGGPGATAILPALAAPTGAGLIGTANGETAQTVLARVAPAMPPYVILSTGQSNSNGTNNDGPNPASPRVSVWDQTLGQLGSSDFTELPLSRSDANGNSGNNNYALARAHRIAADQPGREVVVIHHATGGRAIEAWTDDEWPAGAMWAGMEASINACLTHLDLSKVDEIIWAQGEANFEDIAAVYTPKLQAFMDRVRGAAWCSDDTPLFFMAPSKLHERYQWSWAAQEFCNKTDNRCIWVPANVPNATEYQSNGNVGDYTHFLGWMLWHQGYFAIEQAARIETAPLFVLNRALGAWVPGDNLAILRASSLCNLGSTIAGTGASISTTFNAANSFAWGDNCQTFGTGSQAIGRNNLTESGASYSMVSGENVIARAAGGRSTGGGRDHELQALYVTAFGRGHIVNVSGATAVGLFSAGADIGGSPVMFRVGNGGSSGSRSNAFSVTNSGVVTAQTEYRVGANKVLGAQGAAVADPTSGATVDTEARAAIAALLERLRTHGLIAA